MIADEDLRRHAIEPYPQVAKKVGYAHMSAAIDQMHRDEVRRCAHTSNCRC